MSSQLFRDLIYCGELQNCGYNDYNGGIYIGSDGW